MEPWLYEWA